MDLLSFAAVSGLSGTAPGPFTAEVSPEWTIGGRPNGGYLLAMLGAAAVELGPHPHVIAASAHYLAPPDHGPVTVKATQLRAGRSAAQFRTRMVQDGRPCVEALVTTATLPMLTVPDCTSTPRRLALVIVVDVTVTGCVVRRVRPLTPFLTSTLSSSVPGDAVKTSTPYQAPRALPDVRMMGAAAVPSATSVPATCSSPRPMSVPATI